MPDFRTEDCDGGCQHTLVNKTLLEAIEFVEAITIEWNGGMIWMSGDRRTDLYAIGDRRPDRTFLPYIFLIRE